MKKTAGFLLAMALLIALPTLKLHAQASFEGTITWNMTMPISGDDDNHSMIINVKGKKTEMEMDMGAMGMIKSYSDQNTKKTYMVMGAMKTGYIMDMANDSDSKLAADNSLDLKPTGQKATIGGHAAEEYLLTGIKSRTGTADLSIWVASDFPKRLQESFYNSMRNQPGQDPKQSKAMMQLAAKGLIPVKIVAKSGGETAMSMEFVKYDEKKLDDSVFIPPTDIKFQPMPHMGGGGMN